MTKPGLSDNEQQISDGILGVFDDLVSEQGGIAVFIWHGVPGRPGIRQEAQRNIDQFLDGLQNKDDLGPRLDP